MTYDVVSNGITACNCPDYERHGADNPEYVCKHGYSVLLVRAARKLLRKAVPIGYLRQAYHMVTGDHGHARELSDGRIVFHPGGHKYSFLAAKDEFCLGPVLTSTGRPLGRLPRGRVDMMAWRRVRTKSL